MPAAVGVLVFAAGLSLVVATLLSAIRTTVLPRGVPTILSRTVFLAVRQVMRLFVGKKADYERRDRIMAYYAPVGLFATLFTWLVLVFAGYVLMFFAAGYGLHESVVASGSSLFTLGFSEPDTIRSTVLIFSEAGIGLMLLALLISFLPSLYNAYSRREIPVTKLATRAGQPASGVRMIVRAAELGILTDPLKLAHRWEEWQDWFADITETHQTFPSLTFFRSPQPDRSWITAVGAVLDAAALRTRVVDAPVDLEAGYCLAGGVMALHEIAHFFRVPHTHDHTGPEHISVTREEFDAAYDVMAAAGAPLLDRDQAWLAFVEARAQYDSTLVMICEMVDAPEAPWSSDRERLGFRLKLNPFVDAHVHEH